MTEDADEGAPLSVWIGLSVIAAVSFYCQAAVTEERFVPALNVLATEYNIPDDVAGATLMAAGASSPELFSSIVSLFITHSALGLGTIVGSEIFNQLVICAGAVYAAKSGRLQLDKMIVTREVGFYALSIALLLYAMKDTESADDDQLGPGHIYISFLDAFLLAFAYVLYVVVCANFDALVNLFGKPEGFGASRGPFYGSTERHHSVTGSFHLPDKMPFLYKSFKREPKGNFDTQESLLSNQESAGSLRSFAASQHSNFLSTVTSTLRLHSSESTAGSYKLFNYVIETEKPSDHRTLYDMEANAFDETLSVFLWQRSFFYSKATSSANAWHLRWFTFTRDKVFSVPDRAESRKHRMRYPRFTQLEIDPPRLMIKIANPKEGKRDFYLVAPCKEIFDAVLEKCEAIMAVREAEDAQAIPEDDTDDIDPNSESDPYYPLTSFPWTGSFWDVFFHILLFPFKALMQYTIPDVRHLDQEGNPKAGLGTAFAAIFMCLVWLIIGSYAMVASLEDLAALMAIPDAVIGVTVSAAGTSLPNYVASKVAAEKGFGNMAVSNAFGSNTFNIMVGLGWPWVLYIAFANHFQPYHGLRSEGIIESVIILASVLLVFVVIVLTNNFTLYKRHGILFLVLYAVYIAYEVGRVYF